MPMITMTLTLDDANAEAILNVIEHRAAHALRVSQDMERPADSRAYWAERATYWDALASQVEAAREAALTAIGAR